MCNKCGADLGIIPLLLGMTKEWMILSLSFLQEMRIKKYVCLNNGCNKNARSGSGGQCSVHAMQAQRVKKSRKRNCKKDGCDKYAQLGCGGHILIHATQEQRDGQKTGKGTK